jgi:hypothetical protein
VWRIGAHDGYTLKSLVKQALEDFEQPLTERLALL